MGWKTETLKLGSIAILLPGVWWLLTSKTMNPPREEASVEDQMRSGARLACRELISDRLHDPRSADWGMNSGTWYVRWPASLEGDTVTVQPAFRAANALGGLVLSRWQCSVRRTETGWSLVELREL